jgi:hypothetical protein
MPVEYHCPSCDETFREETAEAVLKRAAAHDHTHHGGPETLTPGVEAALREHLRTA